MFLMIFGIQKALIELYRLGGVRSPEKLSQRPNLRFSKTVFDSNIFFSKCEGVCWDESGGPEKGFFNGLGHLLPQKMKIDLLSFHSFS